MGTVSGFVVIAASNSLVPRCLPVRRGKNRNDAAGQCEQPQQDERSPGIVMREGPQNAAIGDKETGEASQQDAANEANDDGKNKIRPLALFYRVRWRLTLIRADRKSRPILSVKQHYFRLFFPSRNDAVVP